MAVRRARQNLGRHPNYILAAFMAAVKPYYASLGYQNNRFRSIRNLRPEERN